MKSSKLTLGIAISAIVFFTACTAEVQTISEESFGFRKTDLYSEKTTIPDKTMYSKESPGMSKKIQRAYENAPPMIPHSVEGLLPITINNNSCIGCHEPATAKYMGATPIPKSHFTDFRPVTRLNKDGKITKDGKVIVNTADHSTGSSKQLVAVAGSRFNCTLCHAPQSTGKLIIENEFESIFRNPASKDSSNLSDNINEGVK